MPPESREPQEPPARTRVETIGLVGLAVELLLPASLSAALLLFAATYLPWWNLRGRLGIGVFGVLLVALSFVLSVWVDARTLRGRRLAGKSQLLNRADPKSRLVKFVLGGLVIPVAAFAAANLMRLPDRRTPMALAAQLAVRTPVASRESQLASAVIHARGAAGKVAGISALQASGSPAALNQLFRIAAEDPVVSKGGAEARALAKALAAYGKLATPRLLERFAAAGRGHVASSPGGRDAFERYFGAGFEAMKGEVEAAAVDPATRAGEVARLQVAEAQLKRSLEEIEAAALAARDENGPAGFVMQTFLEMSPGEAADLLSFARQVASDATCSDGVRGQALLLVARLGGKGDLDLLYEQLGSPSPLVEARALQAIAALSARLGPGGGNG